jgi:hypothetical protein
VLIALFGGLAGIVALSSKLKGNVIPGVAIATALMPPLCTAGYGLATLQFNFFFGAIYLFTINTIFIGLATLWTSQILKFPIRTIVDPKRSKKINQIITVVIILVLGPSLYFGYNLVQQEKFNLNAALYINNVEDFEGNYLIKHEVDAVNKYIYLEYAGLTISQHQKQEIKMKAFDFGLDSSNIRIEKGFSFAHYDEHAKELFVMREQIGLLNTTITEKQHKIDSLSEAPIQGNALLKEIKSFYPNIQGCSYAETFIFHDSLDQALPTAIIVFDNKNNSLSATDRSKIEQWLDKRLEGKRIKVIFE